MPRRLRLPRPIACPRPITCPRALDRGTGEDEFFGSVPVEATQGTAEKKNITEDIEKERVGLSGILQGTGLLHHDARFRAGASRARVTTPFPTS